MFLFYSKGFLNSDKFCLSEDERKNMLINIQ